MSNALPAGESRYSPEQLNSLRFLGANRGAVLAALRAYWGEDDYLPAWRQQAEVTMFSRALHAAVQTVLKDDAPEPEPPQPVPESFPEVTIEVGLLVDIIQGLEAAGEHHRAARLREVMV